MGWGSGVLGALGGVLGFLGGGPPGAAAGASIGAGLGGSIDSTVEEGEQEGERRAALAAQKDALYQQRKGKVTPSQYVNPYTYQGSPLQDPGATSVQMDPTDFRLTAIDDLRKRYGAS